MARRKFILELGKLVVAAAWVDGELTHQEVNELKNVLFRVPDVTGEDWQTLELYMASPVSEKERNRLVKSVVGHIRSKKDKGLVITTLARLLEADGARGMAEQEALDAVKRDVEGASTGLLAHLGQAVRAVVKKRTKGANTTREERLDDFIKNRVYFHLVDELDRRGHHLELADQEVRRVCLAAGLMASVARTDAEFSDREQQAMVGALMQDWRLSEEVARLVVSISSSGTMKSLDAIQLSREFFECTSAAERKNFVRCLFRVANACGKTTFNEINAVQTIAKGLKLSHQDFIGAKLTIPRKDRGGL